jgi:hypothetical protein
MLVCSGTEYLGLLSREESRPMQFPELTTSSITTVDWLLQPALWVFSKS